jgi:hypothetical protein
MPTKKTFSRSARKRSSSKNGPPRVSVRLNSRTGGWTWSTPKPARIPEHRSVEVHVVPGSNEGNWSVRNSGAERVSKTFRSQKEAVSYARERARERATVLFIHGRDGLIRSADSYAKGPKEK